MTLAVVETQNKQVSIHSGSGNFTPEKMDYIKKHFCKGCTDADVDFFLQVCERTQLDPFIKQIYPVTRMNNKTQTMEMAIQISIDGYRLVAERTGRYVPGKESVFNYTKEGKLHSATSFVKKRTNDGMWHEIAYTAFYDEFKPAYENTFWKTKPRLMLSKCAEAHALRKAFPNELGGTYTDDEMTHDFNAKHSKENKPNQESSKPQSLEYAAFEEVIKQICEDKALLLQEYFEGCSADYQVKFNEWMSNTLKINSITLLKESDFDRVERVLKAKYEENNKSVNEEEVKHATA